MRNAPAEIFLILAHSTLLYSSNIHRCTTFPSHTAVILYVEHYSVTYLPFKVVDVPYKTVDHETTVVHKEL